VVAGQVGLQGEQGMITGKDLMDWGMQPGPIFKTALKVLGVSQKRKL